MDVSSLLFGCIFANSFLVVLLGGLTFIFFSKFLRVPATSRNNDDLPFISVIVPARNEEGKIERCLRSLAQQNYPRFEIIVIDDRSTDGTGQVIERLAKEYASIKPLKGSDTPSGWIGKCNALVQAVPHAGGQWFLFTDADTFHLPDSLRLAVSYAMQKESALISFMPVQELGSFWERLIMPVLLGSFLVGDPFNKINDPKDPRSYAYGQYILIRKDVYEAVGGHASVANQILDDIVFARVVKGAGYPVNAADGQLLYRVRMYTDMESTWHGWTKNAYALIECNPLYLAIVLFLINSGILFPFIHAALVSASFMNNGFSPILGWTTCALVVEFATLILWYRETGKFYRGMKWYHFFILPFGSVAVTALYLTSAYLVYSKSKVQWKGRSYTVNADKAIEPTEAPASA